MTQSILNPSTEPMQVSCSMNQLSDKEMNEQEFKAKELDCEGHSDEEAECTPTHIHSH